ncbi:hypothetical protein BLNAU_16449 [Blattamonas nauphoetae]|uniref:Uncharacterized protein n=1 Tax=Blattamonas nauphoetae TaxID=2049346 RepID=A0ABQ9XBL7_9EUKA|nr:hypothetical protein BLNAU_16449 [Blattamonas nauphoetae]
MSSALVEPSIEPSIGEYQAECDVEPVCHFSHDDLSQTGFIPNRELMTLGESTVDGSGDPYTVCPRIVTLFIDPLSHVSLASFFPSFFDLVVSASSSIIVVFGLSSKIKACQIISEIQTIVKNDGQIPPKNDELLQSQVTIRDTDQPSKANDGKNTKQDTMIDEKSRKKEEFQALKKTLEEKIGLNPSNVVPQLRFYKSVIPEREDVISIWAILNERTRALQLRQHLKDR